MTRRRAVAFVGAVVGLVLVGAVVFLACRGETARERLERMFGLADVGSEQAIGEGLLAKLRPGTPEADVIAFLERSGVGADGLSSYRRDPDGHAVWCRFDLDVRTLEFVKEEYVVTFLLDDEHALRGIDVVRSLKGT